MRHNFLSIRQMTYANGCAGAEAVHVYNGVCPQDRVREFARTRSSGFIKQSYLATLMMDPSDKAAWDTGIAAGDIIVVPKTSGSFDPGTPKELPGFGDIKSSYGTREMKLSFNDPDYVENYAFYNEISDRTDLVPFYRTSSQVHIFDTVASVVASDPAADDLEAEIIWNVVCTVVSKNLPSKHAIATITDIFNPTA